MGGTGIAVKNLVEKNPHVRFIKKSVKHSLRFAFRCLETVPKIFSQMVVFHGDLPGYNPKKISPNKEIQVIMSHVPWSKVAILGMGDKLIPPLMTESL